MVQFAALWRQKFSLMCHDLFFTYILHLPARSASPDLQTRTLRSFHRALFSHWTPWSSNRQLSYHPAHLVFFFLPSNHRPSLLTLPSARGLVLRVVVRVVLDAAAVHIRLAAVLAAVTTIVAVTADPDLL